MWLCVERSGKGPWDDWGLKENRGRPGGLGNMSGEDGEQQEEGGSSLEELTEEEQEDDKDGRSMGTDEETP